MHQPTNGKPAPLVFPFCSRDMTDTKLRKKYQRDHILTEKKWNCCGSLSRLCACAVQTRIQSFRSKLANIERGIAVLPLVVIITRSRGAFLSLYFRWLFEYNIIFFKNVLSRSNTISSIYILAVGNTPYGKLHISRTKLWKSSGVYCSPEESFHSRQYFW